MTNPEPRPASLACPEGAESARIAGLSAKVGRVYGQHALDNFPLPRIRLGWDGPLYAWVTFELSTRYADAVLGVTWEFPSWFSVRLDRLLRKVGL